MSPSKSLQRAIVQMAIAMWMVLSNSSYAFAQPLIPFEAEYTAYKWGDDIGNAELKLKRLSKNQYALTYSSDVSKFFLSDQRYEHSIFSLENDQFIPQHYYYSRTGTGSDKKLKLEFVDKPERKIIVNSTSNIKWGSELDNQLYRIDLPRQLAAGKKSLTYNFINYRGELKTYQIDVIGNETLSLPYGKLATIKVQIVRHSSSRETFAWFAPKLDYNLVRLQQFKDDDEQGDIKLVRYTRLN